MELSVEAIEADQPVAAATDFADWLKKSRDSGIDAVRQMETSPKPGEQGPTLESLLSVVLAAPAVVAFVHCFFRYLEARRPKWKFTFKHGDKTLTVDCTNPPAVERLTESMRELLRD